MQYYKGNALRKESQLQEESPVAGVSFPERVFRIVVFPALLIFWIVQIIVYKSLEDHD